ncbi:MAG: T9SS type A sorting domain-containing protein [Bacteroidetes bacterium]|nr:T9SS type A sorting domain-containing protein [Bacteroidota bacterium]
MKYSYLFLIVTLLLITKHTFSQTFEKYISTDKDEVALDAIEIENNSFMVLSQKSSGDFDAFDYMIKIYKLSYNGDFEDSLNIWINDDYRLEYTRHIFHYDSNKFIIVGNCQNRISLDYQLYLAFINEELEFISDTIVGDTTRADLLSDYLINDYGNVIAAGMCEDEPNNNRLVIVDYSPLSNTYKRYPFKIAYGYSITTLIELSEINAYHLFLLWSGDSIIQINRDNLLIDTTYYFPNPFDPFSAISIPGSNNYFVAGKKTDYNLFERKIAYRKLNIYGEILDEHMYGVDDTNYFYSWNEVDCIDSTYFYLGGTHNFENIPPFLYPEPRWIFVNKLQMDGSIIWQHFYKGELNYMPYKILATSDGGALILSHKYDWNSPYPNQRDIHILKVDSNGYYSGMTSIDEITGDPLQILVYPNPATSIIHIATGFYDNLEFYLYDIHGKNLMHKRLNGSNPTISVEQLPPGMYLYTIMRNQSILERSRLVIQ